MSRDLTARKFGRLTVIRCHHDDWWVVKCVCGYTKLVRGVSLTRTKGATRSCGCLSSDTTAARNTSHGKSHTVLYSLWQGMLSRCYNKNAQHYLSYGGRGIIVHQSWRHDFLAFECWALSNGFKEGLELDRINNDLGYFPENCRWATRQTQMRNTRRNVRIQAFGESKLFCEWAEDPRCCVSQETLRWRVAQGNWITEEALTVLALERVIVEKHSVLCGCGCGQLTKPGSSFIHGHAGRLKFREIAQSRIGQPRKW